MFSPKIFKMLSPSIKICGWTKVFPFSWDANRNILKVTKSQKNEILTKVLFVHYFVYIGYNLYRLNELVERGGGKIMTIFWVGYLPAGYYVSFEGVLTWYLKKEEMVTFFRWMTEFDTQLKRKTLCTFFV